MFLPSGNLYDVNVFLLSKNAFFNPKGEEMAVDTLDLGRCASKWNPSSQAFSCPAASSVSIPRKAFKDSTRAVKTYILSIQVTVPVSKLGSKRPLRKKTGLDDYSERDFDGNLLI